MLDLQLFLVRHGESESNRAGVLEGYPDSPLTALGRGQAEATAQKLAAMNLSPDLLISSPLVRARHTASIIAAVLGGQVIIDDRLRAGEGRIGEPEAQAAQEMAAVFAEAGAAGHRAVVAVSHRLPIRAYLASLVGAAEAQALVDRLPNGGIWSSRPARTR